MFKKLRKYTDDDECSLAIKMIMGNMAIICE